MATNLLATWLRRTRITVRHGHRLLNLREPACVVQVSGTGVKFVEVATESGHVYES